MKQEKVVLSVEVYLKVNKARPRSYRVNYKNNIQRKDENNDLSFISNISLVNQKGVNDSFSSFRNESNASKMSKDNKNPLLKLPGSNNPNLGKNIKKLKLKKGIKLQRPKIMKNMKSNKLCKHLAAFNNNVNHNFKM